MLYHDISQGFSIVVFVFEIIYIYPLKTMEKFHLNYSNLILSYIPLILQPDHLLLLILFQEGKNFC